MVFKRRDRRPIWRIALEALWPRGGWGRAAQYVKHRLRRLPDRPERIARGIFAGVFAAFTPFYGLHFITAAIIARVMRGNMIAALLGTFFGNPLTYVPIGAAALQTGHFLLGTTFKAEEHAGIVMSFVGAWRDLKHNFLAMFTAETANWGNLRVFYDEVFFPYLIGGIIPGIIAGAICYYISVPLITAYQKRRRGLLKARLAALAAKAQKSSADKRTPAE